MNLSETESTIRSPSTEPAIRGWLPKFRLRTLLLLIAATATWIAWFESRRTIQRETLALEQLHVLAPELLVRNEREYACLKIDRNDDFREFEYYLPQGRTYQLKLSSMEAIPEKGPWEVDEVVTIEAGRHRLIIDEDTNRIRISIDGKQVMDTPRQPLTGSSYSSNGASSSFTSQWYPLDKPLLLIQLREYKNNRSSPLPVPGYVLWIDVAQRPSNGS